MPVDSFDASEVIAGLSNLILQPTNTCEQLRERFQVQYLPVVDTPAEVGLEYEEYRLPVDDVITLRLWYLPADLDRGVVVYSMGTAGPMACYLYSADLLTKNGWSVVMYEYEGFGYSDGTPSLSTLARDLLAAVEWTQAFTGRPQVTLMGISLGTIPSVAVAVDDPDAINGVILDSPIALRTQIERFGVLVAGQVQQVLERLDPDLVSEDKIEQLYQPLLVFSHGLDIIATPDSVEMLYERAPGPKTIVRFPQIPHASSQFFATDVYLYYLDTFLTGVWEPAE